MASDVRYNMRVELIAAIAYGAFATILAFIPLVLRRSGASAELLALYVASTYLGTVLAGPGLFLSRQGRPLRMAVICWSLARAALLGAAFVTGDVGLLILAAIVWLGEGLPTPIYSGIVQQIYPVEDRGKVMAVIRVGMSVSLLILAPVAGWMLDWTGYRVLFPLAGLIGILAAVTLLRLRFDEGAVRLRQTPTIRHFGSILTHDRRFTLYLAAIVLFGLSGLMPGALIPLVQVDRLHISYTELGWLNLALSLARLLSYFYWGRRIDRWGAVRCLQAAFVINIVAVLPYIWVTRGWMLLPTFVATGFVYSAVDLGFINAAIELARARRIQEYSALQATIIGVRGIIAPFIGVGLLRLGVTGSAIFAVAGGLTLLAARDLHELA
ncbi:MAG: MFS transporter [Chloroflexi bacterium HGW-Chloroflexi-1]|nr:MAG: MFS transporter [Chloroflexi bacterium HGW-Chloroflexi-1]